MKKSPPHSRKRSRSKTRSDEYRYPPSTLKELRAVIFQFMCSEKFDCPIECDTILLKLRALHSHVDGRMLMSGFSLMEIFRELSEKEACQLEAISVGSRESYLVVSVNKEKLQQLNREASKDRPKKPLSPAHTSDPVPSHSRTTFDVFSNRITLNTSVSASAEVDNLVAVRKRTSPAFTAKGAKFSGTNPCPYVFREACQSKASGVCAKDHYRYVKYPHTVDSWGMCPFPDSCVVKDLCKFIHLEDDKTPLTPVLPAARWVSETVDLASLGSFDVVVVNAGDLDRVKALNLSTVQANVMVSWTPVQYLPDLQRLLSNWRFHLRHSILWVKETNEYRSRESKHLLSYEKEYCVLATRDPAATLPESLRTSLVISDGNAKRPVMIYHLLDACYSGMKLEIYPEALNERQGWVLIGPRSLTSRDMKAVLLAGLLVAVLAGPEGLFAFMDGFQKGLSNSEACEKHPSLCGRGLGNVVQMVGDLQGFRKPSHLKDNTPAANAQLFLTGLVTGLRLDNNTVSPCYSAFNQATYSLSLLYSDVVSLDGHFEIMHAIDSACLADGFLGLDFSVCGFRNLWDDLVNLNLHQMIENFLNSDNMCVITDGWTSIYGCSGNYEGCGFGVGASIRLLLGWGI